MSLFFWQRPTPTNQPVKQSTRKAIHPPAKLRKPSTDEAEYNEYFRHYHEENPDYYMTDGHTSMGDNS